MESENREERLFIKDQRIIAEIGKVSGKIHSYQAKEREEDLVFEDYKRYNIGQGEIAKNKYEYRILYLTNQLEFQNRKYQELKDRINTSIRKQKEIKEILIQSIKTERGKQLFLQLQGEN